jgi:predicted secreted protein
MVLTIAALLSSCLSTAKVARSETPMLHDIVLAEKDSGKTFEVYKGSLVEIRLEGNPTTGYAWAASPSTTNDLILKVLDDSGYIPSKPALTGSGGTFVFKYMAANPGTAKLVFGYARSWETVPPIRTWSVTVKVNDVH